MKFDKNFVFNGNNSVSAKTRYECNPKSCRHCKSFFTFEAYSLNRRRVFCNAACYAKYKTVLKVIPRPKLPPKKCNNCENPVKSRKQDYCSQKCNVEQTYKETIRLWLSEEYSGTTNGVLSKTVRRYLIEQAGNKCSQCGWGEVHSVTGKVPVQIDHINGDSTDNSPNNLRVLCPNCHSLTSTYGRLNKNNKGKEYRREYRAAMRAVLREELLTKKSIV